jgi:nucleotide sugar dehydrogenase
MTAIPVRSAAKVSEASMSALKPVRLPSPSPGGDAVRDDAFAALAREAGRQRAAGREIVVVQGLGFVGAAVAAVIAGARDDAARAPFHVIGLDLPTPAGQAKAAAIAAGETPIRSPDRELDRLTREGVSAGLLTATVDARALGLADVIVVDVGLDVSERGNGDPRAIAIGRAPFEAAVRAVGRHMRPNALVMIESTVPVGTTRAIVAPLLDEERRRRGITAPVLVAHAYERVTPGPRYVESIRAYFRVFAGIDAASAARTRAFLSRFVAVADFPLSELAAPEASELGKLLENSYRAANIALIHEWTLLAERIGIDLFAVIEAIRRRQGTHDNMRLPGFGVGGYCLTKDSLLAQWSATNLYGGELTLDLTLRALAVNEAMPLHTLDLARELAGGDLSGRTVAVLGVAYLPDIDDTRHSPTALLVDRLLGEGASPRVHDPVVAHWAERPAIAVESDLRAVLSSADVAVLAVGHSAYRRLAPGDWVSLTRAGAGLVDANNILDDAAAGELHRAGRRLLGVGKGHWRRHGYQEAC